MRRDAWDYFPKCDLDPAILVPSLKKSLLGRKKHCLLGQVFNNVIYDLSLENIDYQGCI